MRKKIFLFITLEWSLTIFSMQTYSDVYKKEYGLTYEYASEYASKIPKCNLRFLVDHEFAEKLPPETLQAHLDAIFDVLNGQRNKFLPCNPKNKVVCN